MESHPLDHSVFKDQETTLLIVGGDRQKCLEVFQHALNKKVADAHFLVGCLDEDPTQQPPGMPRPADRQLGSMGIMAVSTASELKTLLMAFTRQDPHAICATLVNRELLGTVTQIKATGGCNDGVFIVDSSSAQRMIQDFGEWSENPGVLPEIWGHNTHVVEVGAKGIKVFRLVKSDGLTLEHEE